MENKLLSVITYNRKSYDDIKGTLDKKDFSDLGSIILDGIEDYYKADESALQVDKEILSAKLVRKYPAQAEAFEAVISCLDKVSVPNVLSEYVSMRLHSLGQRIASRLTVGDNSATTKELITEYEFLSDKGAEALERQDEGVFIGMDVDDIFEELDPDNLIQLHPAALNEHIGGGAPRGTHIVVYARPEVGKSMVVINMCSGFLRQHLKVLYLGNEDPASVMRQRILSNLSGMDRKEILMDRDEAMEKANSSGYGNLIFVSRFPGTIGEIRGLTHKYSPDVIIVDQIRNLRSSNNLSKVETLEYIAQSMRNLGKEANALAISVTQAGDSASGKLILDLGDVDFSNTGIPSTADLMIGIGMNHEYERAKRRMISLPKNKISGTHESFPVSVIPELSRVEDV